MHVHYLTVFLFSLISAIFVICQNIEKLVQANNKFGLLLLQNIEPNVSYVDVANCTKNIFLSPFGISTLLTIVLGGAVNQTYTQLYNSLGYSQTRMSIGQIFASYGQLLKQLQPNNSLDIHLLNIDNSIAVQKDFPLLPSFVQNIIDTFNSDIFVEDFTSDAANFTRDINNWIAENTNGKISKIIESNLNQNTVLLLLNAIYFRGDWQVQFDKEHTQNVSFQVGQNSFKTVQAMTVKSYFNYGELVNGKIVEIPFRSNQYSMFIFLPNEYSTETISSLLTSKLIEEKLDQLIKTWIIIQIPRFTIEEEYSLKDTLKNIGIEDAFDSNADFSNINGKQNLKVSEVIQKTFIEVDEDGSDATGASMPDVMAKNSLPSLHKIVTFRVDHPFLFFIRDIRHKLNLFYGIVNNP